MFDESKILLGFHYFDVFETETLCIILLYTQLESYIGGLYYNTNCASHSCFA